MPPLLLGMLVLGFGTSLPELAVCTVVARRGEDGMVLGNVLGSALGSALGFSLPNTLAVVGLAGAISPMDIEPVLLSRDLPVVAGLNVLLFVLGGGFRGPGRIDRTEGGLLLLAYLACTAWLLSSLAPASA